MARAPAPQPWIECETGIILSGYDSGSGKDFPDSDVTPARHEMPRRLRFQAECSTGSDPGSAAAVGGPLGNACSPIQKYLPPPLPMPLGTREDSQKKKVMII